MIRQVTCSGIRAATRCSSLTTKSASVARLARTIATFHASYVSAITASSTRSLHHRAEEQMRALQAERESKEVNGIESLDFSHLFPSEPRNDPGLYSRMHALSLSHPDAFWIAAARSYIHWTKQGTRALSPAKPGEPAYKYAWFASDEDPTGKEQWEVNACDNMIDRHVQAGRGDRVALIYDSPVQMKPKADGSGSEPTVQHITYSQLLDTVSTLAGALRAAGVKKGDRVLIYMPMIPSTVAAMLATVRLGAIHAVVFGGFPAAELAKRIGDAKPTVILTASCGLEGSKILPYKPALDEAIRISGHMPQKVLVLQRPQCKAELVPGRDADWIDFVRVNGKLTDCVPVKATDPLYILYTSGTTGMPKGVVRDNGSIVALHASMSIVYGHSPNETFWSASDLGWAVGHSYIVYGPLLQGCTSVLYEGKPVGTPDAGAFWRVISQHRVSNLLTAPTALRAIKKEDSTGSLRKRYDLSSLRALFLAGERADPSSLAWARDLLGVPVLDHCWMTETGWAIVGSPRGVEHLPVKDGSATMAMPGYDLRVFDDEGVEVPRGTQGNLVLRLPMPPSCVQQLWQNESRFIKSYVTRFPGYFDTADAGRVDEDGYVYIMARTDDVMNVAGHRLSSGQMEGEIKRSAAWKLQRVYCNPLTNACFVVLFSIVCAEVLCEHPSVAECAVVAVPDALRGHVPVGLVVLKSSQSLSAPRIESECVAAVRARVGAIACLKRVVVVPRLPKTRSGKVLRAVLRAMAEGKDKIAVPPTIEDETVLAEVQAILNKEGIVQRDTLTQ